MAGAALLLLVAIDHRKPVRRHGVAPRKGVGSTRRAPLARTVEHLPTQTYKRTPLWRRFLSVGGLGVIGVVMGALLAIAVAAVVVGGLLLIRGLLG